MSIKDIRRATRKHYSVEEKIRIILDGLRGEDWQKYRHRHLIWGMLGNKGLSTAEI
jgi:hypothetical protein